MLTTSDKKYIKRNPLKKDAILTYKVVKSNKLVEAKSDFTALQHKIIILALAQIKFKDTSLRTYTIRSSHITDATTYSNYTNLKLAVKRLQNTSIGINDNGSYIDYPFVENISIQKVNGLSTITITFSPKVERFLIGLRSKYTAYTLENVINFKHNYSLRIYELCKQYESVGYREISLDNLKDMLNLETKYKKFTFFYNYVLLPAFEEINKFSDIYVKADTYVVGKKVEIIKFIIVHNKALMMLEQIKILAKQGFNR